MTLKTELVTCLADEIVLRRDFLSEKKLETIYFGGGTPSILSEKELNLLFESIHRSFSVDKNTEITLEANPDDLSLEKLLIFKKAGINRLSIGIQSFDEHELKWMNRNHTALQSHECLSNARIAGFENINVDLIYSIPGSTQESLIANIDHALFFHPEHISGYCLTVEEGTAFGKWLHEGKISELEDDLSFLQYEILINHLSNNGLDQYEISNFCKQGFSSKHNSKYWENNEYLGIGPSAHSYNGTERVSTVSNNIQYIKSIKNAVLPVDIEKLTSVQQANEYIMTRLRKNSGLNIQVLRDTFDFDILEHKAYELKLCLESSTLLIVDGNIMLTTKGRFLSNTVISMLIK